MADTLSGLTITSSFRFAVNGPPGGPQGAASANPTQSSSATPAVGTAAGQCDSGVDLGTLSIISGTAQNIVLGSQIDPLGNTLTIGHVRAANIQNLGGTGTSLIVTGIEAGTFTIGTGGHLQFDLGASDIAAPTLTLASTTLTVAAAVKYAGRST